MTISMPKKHRKRLLANVDKKVMVKAPKKKIMPKRKSAISKEREEDSAKQITQRNTQGKSSCVQYHFRIGRKVETATALVPVQPDDERTALLHMVLRKRKMTVDIEGMPEWKKKGSKE
jgi:hypothetical protein